MNKEFKKLAPVTKLETKRCKRLRQTICVLYVLTIFFCALPFAQVYNSDGSIGSFTIFNLLIDGFRYGADYFGLGVVALIILLIPIVGFLFASFDKTRILKCIVGLICSLVGIALICFGLGSYVSIGGMLSIITYMFIAVLSVYLMLVISADRHNQKIDKEEARPQHNFKLDKQDEKSNK